MRALVCSELNGIDGLAVGDLPEPELTPGTARVAVESAGANFPDILITQGLYQFKPDLPFAPGMEFAGTVTEVGDDTSRVAVGDRVYGSVGHGAFAEQVVAPTESLFAVPDGMGADVAAALPITFGTSYHALVDRAQLEDGESLLVLGAAGGVGIAAVQIGAKLGATVIAAVSSDEKAATVRENGAAHVIRYDQEDLRDRLKRISQGGVDVVFDPVGGETTEAAFRSLAWEGRHLVIGFAAGDIPALPLNLALLKGASLVGVFWGRFTQEDPGRNRENFETMAAWWSEGNLEPVVSRTYSLEEAPDALRALGGRQAIGKLIVNP